MKSPQNFTGRAGSGSSGRVRRALDAAIDTERRNGSTLEVKDGRLEVKVVKGGALKNTRRGLELDPGQVGEMNRPPLDFIRDPEVGATAADLRLKLIEIMAALRKTGNMKG